MTEELIRILETYGYPVLLQGSMQERDEYPDAFFTFWNTGSPKSGYFNNKANFNTWFYWVYFYTNDPGLKETIVKDVIRLLEQYDWHCEDNGTDAISDVITHTGKLITVFKTESR